MTDQRSLVMAQLDVAGTYTLTSSSANTPAFAPAGDPYTAFTGALVEALDQPTPLSLNDIYSWVDRALAARGLPRPQQRATNTAGELALVRGPSHQPPPDAQPPDSTGQVLFEVAGSQKWGYLVGIMASLAVVAGLALTVVLNNGVPIAIGFALFLVIITVAVLMPYPGPLEVGPAGLTTYSALQQLESRPGALVAVQGIGGILRRAASA